VLEIAGIYPFLLEQALINAWVGCGSAASIYYDVVGSNSRREIYAIKVGKR
jgi:hypothetical protein